MKIMTEKKETSVQRVCIDCGKDISNLHHNAKRCGNCSKERKKAQDRIRVKKKQDLKVKWHNFIEDPESKELTHRSAKGSKLRYWLDKICKVLNNEELEFLLLLWNWRLSEPNHTQYKRREYRTCAGIVRDWRDYFVVNNLFNNVSFDSENGVIFNNDGSYYTVDFDEDNENYIIRNSEGTIICKY